MYGPKDSDDDDDDGYNDKMDGYMEGRISRLEDIRDARDDGDPYKEELDQEIDNIRANMDDDED